MSVSSGDPRPRPMGGRPLPQTPHPPPPLEPRLEVQPLEIRRPKTPLRLQVPSIEPPRRPTTPKISIQLPAANGRAAPLPDGTDMNITIQHNRPPDHHNDPSATVRPPLLPSEPTDRILDEVRQQISELSISIRRKDPESSEDDEETVSREFKGDHWTDDDFEVLARLGEGAGGAVYKVKEKRTGRIMARKTIPTHSTPAIQLIRELSFMSTDHPHIIEYLGAYISPSSSEVNVLMELCEGGSLDAVSKKVSELKKRISEAVIAQLALGVRYYPVLRMYTVDINLAFFRSSRVSTTFTQRGLSIEISNRQISFLVKMVLLNCAILESRGNWGLTLWPAHSQALDITWQWVHLL
jgi:mitogen-activated protein kinase kinase